MPVLHFHLLPNDKIFGFLQIQCIPSRKIKFCSYDETLIVLILHYIADKEGNPGYQIPCNTCLQSISREEDVFKHCGKGNPAFSFFPFNPLPNMPILGSSNLEANKNIMLKTWTNGDTII